ncbi:MAG: hypothetical protein GX813_04760 [Erysipelotrichia bacterium]|nr:hypothetical protein [Erysipelotrichia bacterium]
MRQLRLNQTYYKVLLTLKLLNDQQYYPLNEGIYKILKGKVDEETRPFSAFPVFGTLSSYTSKRISHLTLMLFRYGYIGKIFDPNSNKLFFRISPSGEQFVEDFGKRHKIRFVNKHTELVKTIVKIED